LLDEMQLAVGEFGAAQKAGSRIMGRKTKTPEHRNAAVHRTLPDSHCNDRMIRPVL
jgi:hypothetical protein